MMDALLRSKLHVPRTRRALVARPRLTVELERARDASLVLVSAPAGFGKTTLLASVVGEGSAVGWVSLDARDGDPVRFWTYVLHAMEGASPGCAAAALALLDAGRASMEEVVSALVNEVSVRADEVTMVLDDYHLAETPEVGAGVAFLVEHRPPQLRLVLSTRSDPGLPLPRLRARGELVELRASDLRFTVEESGAYLNVVHDLALADDDVAVLESRTEGWAAALQLAALSLRGRADPASFIASFAGDDRFVMDYLVDEVLDQQPEDLRRFLLDTSVLERLSGPLCDAVVDTTGGAAALETLERRNLLLVPLDDHRHWYRYHHLFADVLGSRLLAERPEQVPLLHRRASRWFEDDGDVEAAVRHAFAAGDVDRAADLIEDAAWGLRRRRAEGTLRSWVPLVPAQVLDRRPVLASVFIGALMASNVYDGVVDRLDALEGTLSASAESLVIRDRVEWERLPAVVATHRAGLALLSGDLDATMVHADDALSRAAATDRLSVAAASALKGLASWSAGDLDSALASYRAATEGLAAAGHISDAMGCTVTVVDLELQQGRLAAAQRAAQHALDLAGDTETVRGAADMWLALGRVAWERGDGATTAECLRGAAELGDAAGLPQQPYRWRVAMAGLREARGDIEGADALLVEAERVYNSDFSPTVRPVPAVRARLHIRTGNLAAARNWAATAGVGDADDVSYLREFEHVTWARLLLAEHVASGDQADLSQAVSLLERLHEAAATARRLGAVVETSILLAVTSDLEGRTVEALGWLEQAARVAGPHGRVRPFLDEGPRVQALVARLDAPDLADFKRAITAQASAAATAAPREREHASAPASAGRPGDATESLSPEALVVPLSARELDVLRLLGSDLDGPAIARHLNVSLATVRTHTQRIYAKLGVNNRRAAVRRGHQLNL